MSNLAPPQKLLQTCAKSCINVFKTSLCHYCTTKTNAHNLKSINIITKNEYSAHQTNLFQPKHKHSRQLTTTLKIHPTAAFINMDCEKSSLTALLCYRRQPFGTALSCTTQQKIFSKQIIPIKIKINYKKYTNFTLLPMGD